jgi:hypothetical protein
MVEVTHEDKAALTQLSVLGDRSDIGTALHFI